MFLQGSCHRFLFWADTGKCLLILHGRSEEQFYSYLGWKIEFAGMICRLMDQRLLIGACVTLKPLHPQKLTLSRGTIHESCSPSSLPNLQAAPPERLLCLAIVYDFCDLREEHWEFCNFHELLGSYKFCKFPILWILSSLQAWMLPFQRSSHLTASTVLTISIRVSILFMHKWRKEWMKVTFRSQRDESMSGDFSKKGDRVETWGLRVL